MSTPPSEQEHRLEQFLGFSLSLIANTMAKVVGNFYSEKYDLGVTEARIIAVAGQDGPVSIREITDKTRIDKGWISRSVTSLLKRELITKQADQNDARKVQLQLTDAGKEIYGDLMRAAIERNNKLLSALSPGEQVLFMELLAQLQTQADLMLEEDSNKTS